MAYALADRVREVTTTTGTSDLVLGGAPSGFQDFATFLADNDTTHYCVFAGTEWEVGLGTFDSGANTLERTTVLDGSDGVGTKITLSAGTKTVFCTTPAALLQLLPKLLGIETGADVTDKDNVAAAVTDGGNKTTLVGADRLPALDSADSYKLKYTSLTNFLTVLGSTFYTKSEIDSSISAALTSARKRGTVRVATIASITISTALNNGDSLDGVTLATGDWVLVKDQSTGSQNGIYVVGAVPARAAEFDTWDEHIGSVISVQEGTVNADKVFMCTSNAGGTLNTTSIVFGAVTINGELLSANNLSDLANAGTARTNLGLTANGSSLVTTNYAGMLGLLGIEAGADVTDEANVRAAIAALTTTLVQNRQTSYRVGTADTQTVMQQFGWGSQQRWATVLEANAAYALYSYSADGLTVKAPFYITADGEFSVLGSITAQGALWGASMQLRDTGADHFMQVVLNTNLTGNRTMSWNVPDASYAYTWPGRAGTISLDERLQRAITASTDTLALVDAGAVIKGNRSSAITITIPQVSSVAWPVGTQIDLVNINTGAMELVAGAGVTLNSKGSNKKITSQYGAATLLHESTNVWVLFGDLEA